jgi:hypothetical protein
LVSSVSLLKSSVLFYFGISHKYRHKTEKSHGRVAPRNRIQLRFRLGNTKKAGAYKHTSVMHQHTQDAEASRRPTNEEYEDSSVSSAADIEKEMIAANALNEGTTNPYEDPIAEDDHQHHPDGGDIEKQTTRRSIQSGNAVAANGLEKQTTRRSVRSGKAVSVNNVSAIPNGGTKAWLQVLGAFFLFFNSWGISKNNFMEKYKQMANSFNSQHFRRIPDLLPIWHSLVFVTFGYLLDWIGTSFLAHACWRLDGAHL